MTINKAYDQFLLFGDSITQQAGCQDRGFAFAAALQDGNILCLSRLPLFEKRHRIFCSSSETNDLHITFTTLAPHIANILPNL